MTDTTHSKSLPATHLQLSNIATQLMQFQTNGDSPATQLALSNIAIQLLQLQTHYSEQDVEQQKKLSALEAKSKIQAREISTFGSLVSSLLSELHVVRSKQERTPLSEPAEAKPINHISRLESLPDAIRQRIWRYTFPEPRVVQLFGTERVLGLAVKIPVAMHICHDSRQEARSVYKGLNMKQIPGGIDFEHDTLYISTAVRYYSPAGLLSDLTRWFELKDIRRVAFQYQLWNGMCDDKEALSRFLNGLKGLQELIIVLDDEVPATPARRKRHVEFIHCGNSVREVIVGMVSRTLVSMGKNSLLSKIRYRKAVRQPVHASSHRPEHSVSSLTTIPRSDSNSHKTPRRVQSADPSLYLAQKLPSPGSPLETDLSKQAATPASSSDPSESPTPQSEGTKYPQPSPPTAEEAFELGLGANKLFLPKS